MSGALLHGMGDCTPGLNCGCLDQGDTHFTQREQAILSRVEELRNSGQQEQLDDLLASIENGETELIEDGTIDALWANVVRSRKITTDMLTIGRIIGNGGMTIVRPQGHAVMSITDPEVSP